MKKKRFFSIFQKQITLWPNSTSVSHDSDVKKTNSILVYSRLYCILIRHRLATIVDRKETAGTPTENIKRNREKRTKYQL